MPIRKDSINSVLEIVKALKEIKDANLVAEALANLTLKTAAQRDVGTAANQIPDMSAFPCSIAVKGYLKLPNGMLLQWGTKSIAGANASGDAFADTYAIPFPNGVLTAYASGTQTLTDTPCFAVAEAISTTQIRLKAVNIMLSTKTITQGQAVNVAWFAIGQ